LHKARVDSAGLSKSQKHGLKTAEAKLKEATKSAEFGEVKNAKYVKAEVENKKLQKMEKKMDKIKKDSSKKKPNGELEAMRKEIEELRKELKEKEGDKTEDDALLQELADQIKKMEEEDKKDDHKTKQSHDELKSEIERLRSEIKSMEDDKGSVTYSIPKQEQEQKDKKAEIKAPAPKLEKEEEEEQDVEKYDVRMKPLSGKHAEQLDDEAQEATPVESKGIDIDTAMPYGDLEPFGREDTAQELTENSIQESNAMVDQLEKAEVAEEKRSVFRALTRLRGAAITSFDGVARSQTGNIDEYNKIHKWRNSHPLHHLADEESDISKWAFPENAD
jgi:DNA repair exonuclease SbcCD ATPase subunit